MQETKRHFLRGSSFSSHSSNIPASFTTRKKRKKDRVLIDDVRRQHLGQLVVLEKEKKDNFINLWEFGACLFYFFYLQAPPEELLFRQVSVAVRVHAAEDVLGALLEILISKMRTIVKIEGFFLVPTASL